jgi:hypothetical protein
MKNCKRATYAVLLIAGAWRCASDAVAVDVYKCEENGKTSYSTINSGNCRSMDMNIPQVDFSKGKPSRDRDNSSESGFDTETLVPDSDAEQKARNAELAKSLAKAPVTLGRIGRARRAATRNSTSEY